MRPALAALLLAACSGARPGPGPEGPRAADHDADGWTPGEGDCDDRDPDVFPEAPDPPGDGIDQDCDGGDERPLRAVGLAAGDLVITEIHADPIGLDPVIAEWFELRNASGVAVDLDGLIVRDHNGDNVTISEPVVVPAGGVIAIGAWRDPEENGGAPVAWAWHGELRLSNVEDALVLQVPFGVVVDEVAWDARFPAEEGRSLSLNPDLGDAASNDAPEAWCLGQDPYGLAGYGTPGVANPPCPGATGRPLGEVAEGEIVITEILNSPALADGDDGEWIEVTSVGATVIDLAGLTVEDADQNGATIEGSLLLAPGQHLVLAASDDPLTNGGITPHWSWDGALGLARDGDAARLRFGARVFDEVAWESGTTFPEPDGASLSLDPSQVDAIANDLGVYWCAGMTPFGLGDLGTPGTPNPPCP